MVQCVKFQRMAGFSAEGKCTYEVKIKEQGAPMRTTFVTTSKEEIEVLKAAIQVQAATLDELMTTLKGLLA